MIRRQILGGVLCVAVGGCTNERAAPSEAVRSEPVQIIVQQSIDYVQELAFHPSLPLVAVRAGGEISIWDAETGLNVNTFERIDRVPLIDYGQSDSMEVSAAAIAFDPTGAYLSLSPTLYEGVSRHAVPIVFDVNTGKRITGGKWRFDAASQQVVSEGLPFDGLDARLWRFSGEGRPAMRTYNGPARSFSKDGRLAAHATQDFKTDTCHLDVIDTASNERVRRFDIKGYCGSPALSPDGQWLVMAGRVWNATSGAEVPFTGLRPPPGELAPGLWRTTLLGDGKVLITNAREERIVSLSDGSVLTTLEGAELGGGGGIDATTENGRLIAAAYSRSGICIWRMSGAKQLCFPTIRAAALRSADIASDGTFLVLGTDGRRLAPYEGSAYVWPLAGPDAAPRLISSEPHRDVAAVTINPDRSRLAVATFGAVIGDRSSGFVEGNLTACDLPSCATTVSLLDTDRDRSTKNEYDRPELAAASAKFLPDGRLVAHVAGARAYTDEEIRFLEWTAYPRLLFFDPLLKRTDARDVTRVDDDDHAVAGFAVSANGAIAALGLSNNRVKLWDLARGRELRMLLPGTNGNNNETVHAAAFDPKSPLLAASNGRNVTLWDSASGQWRKTVDAAAIGALAFLPDGRTMIGAECHQWYAGRSEPFHLRAWDTTTWKERWAIDTDIACTSQLALSPDGSWFIQPGTGGAIVRATTDGHELLRLMISNRWHQMWLALAPDGRYAGSTEGIRWLAAMRQGLRANLLTNHPAGRLTPTLINDVLSAQSRR